MVLSNRRDTVMNMFGSAVEESVFGPARRFRESLTKDDLPSFHEDGSSQDHTLNGRMKVGFGAGKRAEGNLLQDSFHSVESDNSLEDVNDHAADPKRESANGTTSAPPTFARETTTDQVLNHGRKTKAQRNECARKSELMSLHDLSFSDGMNSSSDPNKTEEENPQSGEWFGWITSRRTQAQERQREIDHRRRSSLLSDESDESNSDLGASERLADVMFEFVTDRVETFTNNILFLTGQSRKSQASQSDDSDN